MASRATLKTWLLSFLGTPSDDPKYPAAVLEAALQQGHDSLLADIHECAPGYFWSEAVLVPLSATSHSYALASQASDFALVLEIRYDDEDGEVLHEGRIDELGKLGSGYYAVRGSDQAASIVTSRATTAGCALWMRWSTWPVEMTDDSHVPQGIPARFHDVVALEAQLYVYGLGGEQRMPKELYERWQDRRGQMLSRVSRRSVEPTRTRIDPRED